MQEKDLLETSKTDAQKEAKAEIADVKKVLQKLSWGKKISEEEVNLLREEEKKKILEKSQISLWLDGYDDIFSDFDPRPYPQRSLSDDFLNEAKKASKEKTSGFIELKLLLPEKERDTNLEIITRKRLKDYFKKHHDMAVKETSKIRKTGVWVALAGMGMMVLASYITFFEAKSFLWNLLFVALEPTGWFMVWFGLDQFFFAAKQKKQEIEFYEKMAKCQISFLSI